MTELETATVVWFNRQMKYGFAEDQWGQQIFFHLNDGRNVVIEKGELVFYKPRAFSDNKVTVLSEPKKGSVIQFIRAKGSRGRSKAKPWTYESMVTRAYMDEYEDNQMCSCGHLMLEHSGDECQHSGCHCGDEGYYDREEDYIGTNVGGDPGGFNIYDSLG